MNTITAVTVLTIVCGACCAIRAIQHLRAELDLAQKQRLHLVEELEECRKHCEAVDIVLHRTTGGIGARISEAREIAEAIFDQASSVFRREPGLLAWLEANDRFLVELMTAAKIQDPFQQQGANRRTSKIYRRIRRVITLPEAQS